jgi:hypothetical protein
MLVLMFFVVCSWVSKGSDCATASSSRTETAAVALPLVLVEPDDEGMRERAVMLRARGARAVAEAFRLSSTRTHTDRLLCGAKVAWQ